MPAFKTKAFSKWQKKELIKDRELMFAIEEIINGLMDADLGGGLVKKRIRRNGSGKRSGYRTLIATNKGNKWFFIYGFAKNERHNIHEQEERAFKQLAKDLLSLNNVQVNKAMKHGELMEVIYE